MAFCLCQWTGKKMERGSTIVTRAYPTSSGPVATAELEWRELPSPALVSEREPRGSVRGEPEVPRAVLGRPGWQETPLDTAIRPGHGLRHEERPVQVVPRRKDQRLG